MIADALNTSPRSLEQYAEELRAEVDDDNRLALIRARCRCERCEAIRATRQQLLLAVEREINWRMGL